MGIDFINNTIVMLVMGKVVSGVNFSVAYVIMLTCFKGCMVMVQIMDM